MKLLHSTAVLACILVAASAIAPNSLGSGKSLVNPFKQSPLALGPQLKPSQLISQAAVAPTSQSSEPKLQSSPVNEALAGFVVSLATLPKAIAFSTVLGLSPLTGIWTTVAVSLAVTIFGQSPG